MDDLRDASTADAHAQLVLAFQVLVACVAGGIVGLDVSWPASAPEFGPTCS